MIELRKRVKITITCTPQEREHIKKLAKEKHLTISEYVMSHIRPFFPITIKYK